MYEMVLKVFSYLTINASNLTSLLNLKYEDSKRCSKYKDDNKSELKQTGEVKSVILKTVSSEQTFILKMVRNKVNIICFLCKIYAPF